MGFAGVGQLFQFQPGGDGRFRGFRGPHGTGGGGGAQPAIDRTDVRPAPEGPFSTGESSGCRAARPVRVFCGTHSGKNSGTLSSSAKRKCCRKPARRQHSRLTALVQHGAGHRPAHQCGYSVTRQEGWPKIAVVGAGAVGGYFGGLLARADAPVVMIGRPAFVEAVKKNGLFLDTLQFQESVRVESSTELSAVRGAEIVLFCVKTTDNATTARSLAPLLAPGALVLSLQNGVDNVEQIRAAAAIEALPTVVYVAASVPEPGRVKHVGRGDLVFGPQSQKTERVAALFSRASVPCRISQNIEGELWTKLIWNCALNAISALGRAKYGQIAASADARKVVENVVDEVLAVAAAARIRLPGVENLKAGLAGALQIATQMSGAISSTGQDLMRAKRNEIDSLHGYIARRGAELGVPTPVNHALFALVKLAEQSNEAKERSKEATK